MKSIKVKEVMTPEPFIIRPEQTVREAAEHMKRVDCGALPVGNGGGKVVGMITDRDITLRVTAAGKDPDSTSVHDVMTKKVYACDENADIGDAARTMRKNKVQRLIVTKNKKATGIVTSRELLQNKGDAALSGDILHELMGQEEKTSPTKSARDICAPAPDSSH